jgi:hypothetical protein
MNVESILRAFAKHLRREEYGSAAQLANTELGDGRYDNVEHIADALDRWETGSGPLLERTFCFRSVYRSMLFEDSLRRAIGQFIGEHSLPPAGGRIRDGARAGNRLAVVASFRLGIASDGRVVRAALVPHPESDAAMVRTEAQSAFSAADRASLSRITRSEHAQQINPGPD